jgi:branched-chain amino acid transport system permease protein
MSQLPSGTYNSTYGQDMAIVRTKLQWVLLIVFIAFLLTFPLFMAGQYIYLAIYMGVGVIAALGLNILTGYCGQISIGQSAFMAVGAFSAGLLIRDTGVPFWAAIPISGIVAGLSGLVFGIPSLRIKGLYLALATLAAQFIILFVIVHGFKAGTGVYIPAPTLGGITFNTDRSYYYIVIVIAIIVTFLAKNIVRSNVGRAFIAIRDNDIAAEVMGINIFRYKLLAFFIGCFFAGVAGCLWATYLGLATTESYTLLESIWLLGMCVVGGLGSISGTIIGVIALRLIDYGVQLVGPALAGAIPALSANLLSALQVVVFGIVLLLFLMFEPRGLAHRWEIFKASYRMHPWSY